jgi:hypothetical protein
MNTCPICSREYAGLGNNALPVSSGRCCDECNLTEVIPARVGLMLDDDRDAPRHPIKLWPAEKGDDD